MSLKLSRYDIPEWLSCIQRASDMGKISIKLILNRSLFYPCSGRDGDPIKFLGGFIHSFIYADNGVTSNQVANSLNNPERNFKGYFVEYEMRDHFYGYSSIWFILKRTKDYGLEHGPDRLSLLYISGNDLITFKNLYVKNNTYPEVVVLIKSGFMGSDNYDKDGGLAQAVLNNPNGCPAYMLECVSKGRERECSFWGEHTKLIGRWSVSYDDLDLILWGNKTRKPYMFD